MHTPSPEEFVRALGPALRQASSIARALEGRVANRPKTGEATPVKAALTIADTAAQEALLVPLFEQFPGVRVEAEENTPTVTRFAQRGDALVVIDPIDGTLRFYLEGLGPYGVMVGLAVRGVYEAALVALPRQDLAFSAVRGGGAVFAGGDEAPRAARLEGGGDVVYVSHELPAAAAERLRERGYRVVPACGGAISVAPLVPGVAAGLRIAGGSPPDVSIRGRIGALIAEEAGALVYTEGGERFPRDIGTRARALIVASSERELEALDEALGIALD
jgi:fructose-1,6-bisphosphatase/inositol monophosphatase family enzyme